MATVRFLNFDPEALSRDMDSMQRGFSSFAAEQRLKEFANSSRFVRRATRREAARIRRQQSQQQ